MIYMEHSSNIGKTKLSNTIIDTTKENIDRDYFVNNIIINYKIDTFIYLYITRRKTVLAVYKTAWGLRSWSKEDYIENINETVVFNSSYFENYKVHIYLERIN